MQCTLGRMYGMSLTQCSKYKVVENHKHVLLGSVVAVTAFVRVLGLVMDLSMIPSLLESKQQRGENAHPPHNHCGSSRFL